MGWDGFGRGVSIEHETRTLGSRNQREAGADEQQQGRESHQSAGSGVGGGEAGW